MPSNRIWVGYKLAAGGDSVAGHGDAGRVEVPRPSDSEGGTQAAHQAQFVAQLEVWRWWQLKVDLNRNDLLAARLRWHGRMITIEAEPLPGLNLAGEERVQGAQHVRLSG